MCRRSVRVWRHCLITAVFILVLTGTLQGQQQTLNVTFEQVSIDNSTLLRGVRAGFPFYVLSIITVQDSAGRYIHGLADTSRWITAADTTELGMPVDSVWKVIWEYHEEDTTLPADPDVKPTQPPYMVTELYDIEGYGLSVALAMDYSGSMANDIYLSEEAARVFVRQMTHNDQSAIIKFTGKVGMFQDFTTDTTLLMEAISRSTGDRSFTGLYDAIYTAIMAQLDQSGRRAVVAYTDGKDNFSSHNIDDVILTAKLYSIPVFTIGLGDKINEARLMRLAAETGGVYRHAASAADLADIYIELYGLIRGFYVMAHTSPDPFYNGTFRIVDLTLNSGDTQGRGKGKYYVPYVPTDLEVTKIVKTDSLMVSGADTTWILTPGDTARYSVTVTNVSTSLAGDILLSDNTPDSLYMLDIEPAPDSSNHNASFWHISRLAPGDKRMISYRMSVDTLGTTVPVPLMNLAQVQCATDETSANNRDSVTVTYMPPGPADIAVSKEAVTDSMVTEGGRVIPYAGPDEIFTVYVKLTNIGELPGRSIQVTDLLPDYLTFIDFQDSTATLRGDTLSWPAGSLAPHGASVTFSYRCRTASSLPYWGIPLVNTVTMTCPQDSFPANNTALDTVWAVGPVPPDPQIRVSPQVIQPTDSVEVEVKTPVPVVSWDLIVLFADGSSSTTYADPFIQLTTTLTPGLWTLIDPDFGDTRMRTDQKQEQVGIMFQTMDSWGSVRSDTAWFEIISSNEFFLDDNRWQPRLEPLGMRFKLSSNRHAEIAIYDISGAFITWVVDGPYLAGWNRAYWDGRDEKGNEAGSGIYLAVLTSGNFQKHRKFILVR